MADRKTYEDLRAIALHGPREQQLEPMSGTVSEVRGLLNHARFSGHVTVIDEPVGFGGSGTAPNPAEIMLAGLGASLQVTCRVYAALMSVVIEQVEVELSGTLDTRGFFDADASVRSGFDGIAVKLRLKSPASATQLQELLKKVQRACPVLDNLRAPTAVQMELVKTA
jgi:uncharacterized OsmC-like protein